MGERARSYAEVEREEAASEATHGDRLFAAAMQADAERPSTDGNCRCGQPAVENSRYCQLCGEKIRQRQRAARRRDLVDEVNSWTTTCLSTLPKWDWARLDNPAFRKRVSPKLLKAERWEPKFGNLALCAPTGSCKTSLLVALAHARFAQAKARVNADEAPALWWFRFVSALDLVAARRNHKLGTEEPEVIRAAMQKHIGVLILDEIGFEDMRDQLVLEIADARYKAGATTIITTGLTPEAFAKRYGASVWRRFTEGGQELVDFPPEATEAQSRGGK